MLERNIYLWINCPYIQFFHLNECYVTFVKFSCVYKLQCCTLYFFFKYMIEALVCMIRKLFFVCFKSYTKGMNYKLKFTFLLYWEVKTSLNNNDGLCVLYNFTVQFNFFALILFLHSSEIKVSCLMKCSSKMLQKFSCF